MELRGVCAYCAMSVRERLTKNLDGDWLIGLDLQWALRLELDSPKWNKNTIVNYITLGIELIWFKTTRKTTWVNHYVPNTIPLESGTRSAT